MKSVTLLAVLLLACGISTSVYAQKDASKSLPPGLQKNTYQGKPLPPGWQKKLQVGDILDYDVYRQGQIILSDDKGLVTVRVEGKLIKIIQNTREIVEILSEL